MTTTTTRNSPAGQMAAREYLETLRLAVCDWQWQAEAMYLAAIAAKQQVFSATAAIARLGNIGDLPEYETRRQTVRKSA